MPRNPKQWDVGRIHDAIEQETVYDSFPNRRSYLSEEAKLTLKFSTVAGAIILGSLGVLHISLNQPEVVQQVVVGAETVVNGILSIT